MTSVMHRYGCTGKNPFCDGCRWDEMRDERDAAIRERDEARKETELLREALDHDDLMARVRKSEAQAAAILAALAKLRDKGLV